MLHKLDKFHHQTVFTSQVIHKNVFSVSYLGISWRHDIWILEKLFDFLKFEIWLFEIWLSPERKELSKWNKEHTKQTSKNIADTAFKLLSRKVLFINRKDNINC